MATFQEVFSIVAFFIFLRETLEASVIIAVLLQCMNRTCPRLKKHVWWGATAGIVMSIIAGGIFAAVYYLAQAKLFQGHGKLIFQGVISYVACILITYLGFAMMRFGNLEKKYMRKLDGAAQKAVAKSQGDSLNAATKAHAWSVFILAASAVLREGIESIIFLAGVGANTSFKAIPLACVAGLIVGLAVGFVIYYGGRSIRDLKIFFIASTVMLFAIAAGQVSLGTQLLSKVGMFGYYSPWSDELAWQYRPITDLNKCCSDEFADNKQFFVLAHAVVGYQSRPTPVIIILYCFYWAVVLTFVFIKWRNGSLFDADYKRKRALLRLSRKCSWIQWKLNRCSRRVVTLESRVVTNAADSALQQKLATAQQQQQKLQQQLDAAVLARDAEQQRLDEEDRQVAAAAAVPSDVESSESGSDSAAAVAVIDDAATAKDVELGRIVSEVQADQQSKKAGWMSKLLPRK
eukprot:GHUV01000275.1.p1 GENE.GHUV01000275.1~~GHUV01000275.1.p1  ORF type:complete len:461 (+),score=117.55 GHUV01000275.1:285-1667(+)